MQALRSVPLATFLILLGSCRAQDSIAAAFANVQGKELEYHTTFARPALEAILCVRSHEELGLPLCRDCTLLGIDTCDLGGPYYEGLVLEVRGRWILVEFESPGPHEHYVHPSFTVKVPGCESLHARGVARLRTRWVALLAEEETEHLSPGLEVVCMGEDPLEDSIFWVDQRP